MEDAKTRRGLLLVLTVVTAVLAAPALFLAVFTVFFFDDPDAGAWAWVAAVPWLTLPLTVIGAPIVSWWLHAKHRYRPAIVVAALPVLHLVVATLVFSVVATYA